MKRLLILALIATAAVPALAFGSTPYLSYGRATNAAKATAKSACYQDDNCVGYGAKCQRVSSSRFRCLEGNWDRYDSNPGEELFCSWYQVIRTTSYGGLLRGAFQQIRCGWVPA